MRYGKTVLVVVAMLLASGLGGVHADSPDLRPEVGDLGRISSFKFDDTGKLWLSGTRGTFLRGAPHDVEWESVTLPEAPPDWPGMMAKISEFAPFDSQRAIAYGEIDDDRRTIFRTADGGATWTRTRLPAALWLQSVDLHSDGKGWISGGSGDWRTPADVLFTEDYGASWRFLSAPFPERGRVSALDFVDVNRGLVAGSNFGEEESLLATTDGGRNWYQLPKPLGEDDLLEDCRPARIDEVHIVEEGLLVRQCGVYFIRELQPGAAWSRLSINGEDVVLLDVSAFGTIAVTAERHVHVGPSLEAVRKSPGWIVDEQPAAIATFEGLAVLADEEKGITVLSDEHRKSYRILGKGTASSWPIRSVDTRDGSTYWGISWQYLYRSRDRGMTWARIAETPSEAWDLAIDSAGDPIVWDMHGTNVRWNAKSGVLESVAGLEGHDIIGLQRRGETWLAYGGMQHEAARRIEVARTFFGSEFAGSTDYGWIAASTDGGLTWTMVERWEQGGIQKLFWGDDDSIVVLSWLGSVRRGGIKLEDGRYRAEPAFETLIDAYEADRDAVPYVEWAGVLDMRSPAEGWITGSIHHIGGRAYKTVDGGRTWKQRDERGYPFNTLDRLGDGRWISVERGFGLRVRNRAPGESLPWPEGDLRALRVDAAGGLVALMKGGRVLRMAPGTSTWQAEVERQAEAPSPTTGE